MEGDEVMERSEEREGEGKGGGRIGSGDRTPQDSGQIAAPDLRIWKNYVK
jgi:hypothetical protein